MRHTSSTSKFFAALLRASPLFSFEMSDTIKNQLLTAMGFAGKHPTTYSLVIFARGDDVDRTICFVTRRVDSLKYSGRMHNYGIIKLLQALSISELNPPFRSSQRECSRLSEFQVVGPDLRHNSSVDCLPEHLQCAV